MFRREFIDAYERVTGAGLRGMKGDTTRYAEGGNHFAHYGLAAALPFEVFFLVAGGSRMWQAAVVNATLIAVWTVCLGLNAAGWMRTSSVVTLAAPLAAYSVQTWLFSFRAGFLLPMLMTAAVALFTILPRMLPWGIALTIGAGGAVIWSFLDHSVELPRLDVTAATVDGLLVANTVLATVVAAVTAWLHLDYSSLDRVRGDRQTETAEELARTDSLTHLANRRGMTEVLAALAEDLPYSVAIVDLDRFKEVNDVHGHVHGDAVLAEVARVLKEVIGDRGTVSRWGGEEFLVLMPNVRLTAGVAAMERARSTMDALVHSGHELAIVTFSAGLAAAAPGVAWDTAIRVADALLYEAKAAGRNCVRYAQVRTDTPDGYE